MGTAAYLSPEQAEGKPLDARSDIFSFGAVLYEILSGSSAFEGSSTAQVLSAVLRDNPRPLQHVSPALQRIVSRCLEAAPYAEKAYSLAPWMTVNIGLHAAILKRTGDVNRSEELLQKLLPGEEYAAPLGLAHFYLYSGELDKAMDWSEKAIEQRQSAVLFFLNVHVQQLRPSPRWPGLARLLNLPPAP